MKIELNDVSFSYSKKGSFALENINTIFEKNEVVFILGATGSGKSTLVSHLNGLLFASNGTVTVDIDDQRFILNKKLSGIKNIRKNIGIVFQTPENQLFESTVFNDVMFGPLNFSNDHDDAKKSAALSLDAVKLDKTYYEKSPFKLSGGEKRKVAIAGVLASRPRVLIFDEPTSNLDGKSTKQFFEMVKDLKSQGCMIIIISHNENLAYEYADRIIIMSKGKIVSDGDYKSVFENKEILTKSGIETPFIVRVKESLKINNEVRNIKDLANVLRGDTLWIQNLLNM